MRIALVIDHLSTARGGSQCYLFSLGARLVAEGHDVHVFYNRGEDRIERAKHYRIGGPAYPRFLREWSFCRQVDRLVPGLSADAVLAVRPVASATHYRLSNGVHARCFEAEREAIDTPWRRLFYRTGVRLNPKQQHLIRTQRELLTRRNSPRLMTNSHLGCRQLEEDYGIGAAQVTVLYSGVDLNLFHPREVSRTGSGASSQILFAGHNFILKGLHCLMAAMASPECADLNLGLRVVGAGPIRQFERLAARLGISSRVEFLGAVPRDQMPQLYHCSTVLVHPTFYDPCSLASLEAMACGCPVITTTRNGASELIASGRSGWVIDHPRNLEALASAIRQALAPVVAKQMRREAALTAREKLDLQEHVKAVVKWLGG